MFKTKLKKITQTIKSGLKSINRKKIDVTKIKSFFATAFLFIGSWWHVILILLLAFMALYYPLGGLMINNVNKNTNYEISRSDTSQSATVETMAFLINREVNENMWTPNLPFFFPSYFLDNMPNYQLGIISGLSTVSQALAQRIDNGFSENENEHRLKNAAKLLSYDGKIWMFSPQNSFTPVPSAHSQYRKARKELIKYNQDLSAGHVVFYKAPQDLIFILKKINRDISSSLKKTEAHIREESSSFADFKADNLFYYNQGKMYAYYLIMKALSNDYKELIIEANSYQAWTQSIKSLENGVLLSPLFVRNGELNSIMTPNHLQYIAFYMVKTINTNKKIISLLEKEIPQRNMNAN